MRALRWPLAALVALAALVTGAQMTRPGSAVHAEARSASQPVTDNALVCPDPTGTPGAPTTVAVASVSAALGGGSGRGARLRTTPLTGAKAKTTTLPSHSVNLQSTKTSTSTLVHADGPGAAAVAADQIRLVSHGRHRGLLSAPCISPATDVWITGADGRVGYDDTLALANPGTTVVNLTVTAWATKGPLEPPKLQSFTLQPQSAQLLTLSDYAPDAALVTLHIHANSGRVAGQVLDRRVSGIFAAGMEWIPPTASPATDLVVPGFFGGSGGSRRLVLSDPGTRDATVTLRLATTSGNFAPAGHQTVVIRAGHTADVDLGPSLGGSAGAVTVHSDQPVTATGVSIAGTAGKGDRPDTQFQPAAAAIAGPAVLPANKPPFGTSIKLYITAPAAASKLRIATPTGASKVLTINAGRTQVFDAQAAFGDGGSGPLVLTPISGGRSYVSRTLFFYGAHGPLVTGEEPTVLPAEISLPGAVPDEHVAAPGRD